MRWFRKGNRHEGGPSPSSGGAPSEHSSGSDHNDKGPERRFLKCLKAATGLSIFCLKSSINAAKGLLFLFTCFFLGFTCIFLSTSASMLNHIRSMLRPLLRAGKKGLLCISRNTLSSLRLLVRESVKLGTGLWRLGFGTLSLAFKGLWLSITVTFGLTYWVIEAALLSLLGLPGAMLAIIVTLLTTTFTAAAIGSRHVSLAFISVFSSLFKELGRVCIGLYCLLRGSARLSFSTSATVITTLLGLAYWVIVAALLTLLGLPGALVSGAFQVASLALTLLGLGLKLALTLASVLSAICGALLDEVVKVLRGLTCLIRGIFSLGWGFTSHTSRLALSTAAFTIEAAFLALSFCVTFIAGAASLGLARLAGSLVTLVSALSAHAGEALSAFKAACHRRSSAIDKWLTDLSKRTSSRVSSRSTDLRTSLRRWSKAARADLYASLRRGLAASLLAATKLKKAVFAVLNSAAGATVRGVSVAASALRALTRALRALAGSISASTRNLGLTLGRTISASASALRALPRALSTSVRALSTSVRTISASARAISASALTLGRALVRSTDLALRASARTFRTSALTLRALPGLLLAEARRFSKTLRASFETAREVLPLAPALSMAVASIVIIKLSLVLPSMYTAVTDFDYEEKLSETSMAFKKNVVRSIPTTSSKAPATESSAATVAELAIDKGRDEAPDFTGTFSPDTLYTLDMPEETGLPDNNDTRETLTSHAANQINTPLDLPVTTSTELAPTEVLMAGAGKPDHLAEQTPSARAPRETTKQPVIEEPEPAAAPASPVTPVKEEPIQTASIKEYGAKRPAITRPPAVKPPAPVAPPSTPSTIHRVPDITRAKTGRTEVALTFDGGSSAGDAYTVIKALRKRRIRTTVFLTGGFLKKYPAIVRRMVSDGHEIANHLMSHPHLTEYAETFRQRTLPTVTREFLSRELRKTAALYKRITGRTMAPYWRAPYGEVNSELRQWALEEGYIHIGWTTARERKESLDTLDWVNDTSSKLYRTSSEIKNRILNFGRGGSGLSGGIVLMHLGSGREDERASTRLGEIIDTLMARGYSFVRVSRLLKGDRNARKVRLMLAGYKKKQLAMKREKPVSKR